MDYLDVAQEVVDNMLGYLGFVVSVEIDRPNQTIHVKSGDPKLLIGHHGERLDELQYLANRMVGDKLEGAPKFRVDVDNYRASSEDRLVEEADAVASRVIDSGKSEKLEPMNSYHRRIIHNHFKDHEQIKTWSPKDSARLKRVTIMQR